MPDCPASLEPLLRVAAIGAMAFAAASMVAVAHMQHANHAMACAVLWILWTWRTNVVFELQPWTLGVVLRKIQIAVVEFQRWGRMNGSGGDVRLDQGSECGGTLELCTDDSMVPGPGIVGGGGVVRDRDGRWISRFAISFGVGDAFLAEVRALFEGLRHVWELGYRTVVCFSDCAEMVAAVTGSQDVSQLWHREVIHQVQELFRRDWHVSVRYFPRERNMVADVLAKFATRNNCSWQVLRLSPSIVVSLLCQMF